ncbi:hypothetical protein C8J56DRAFT_1059783 [Mycena floridula]|nr:hypothetical protein C8J56DRAFT_1059783 [Mycena floridula]
MSPPTHRHAVLRTSTLSLAHQAQECYLNQGLFGRTDGEGIERQWSLIRISRYLFSSGFRENYAYNLMDASRIVSRVTEKNRNRSRIHDSARDTMTPGSSHHHV